LERNINIKRMLKVLS